MERENDIFTEGERYFPNVRMGRDRTGRDERDINTGRETGMTRPVNGMEIVRADVVWDANQK